ncbi:alpha-amylase/4-alpha-glucanotransferase domain-containing protein [Stratiformator vulcanicus]|uniref:Alpha-amylase 1 n=1 Tax=Stratiformator vulcanicus TaxID=2527980 RepID=A0A517QXX7_9PLAN|nr:alpha-amylase/4-alpha-glucanotransferase domain-containing protein [Stratiformator vulcanicus]QDT36464.1 Alpha-amylase 1 [Stratiformator vulcanicus]
MSCRIRLVLALHDHQPIGNFDGVFEEAFEDSYRPMIDTLAEYPDIAIVLHTSGSLLEWLVERKPEYIDKVRGLVERGQIEILGGPFYEPILANIPSRDRVGQIQAYSKYLENLFGQPIRGMWLPERVWEQGFTRDIIAGGIEYTILDDYHFKNAGLRNEELFDYYLTEDEGKLLSLFPGDETLRYLIPFQKPEKTIDYLRQLADRRPGCVVTFGDDGEKFGTWPGTKSLVYERGWLRRFFDALRANNDWLKVTTLGEAIENVAPVGKFYVSDCSYREMTEWALPTPRQQEFHDLTHNLEHIEEWPSLKQFLRGGFWRNFRVKYPEVNEMYCRMLQVSERLEKFTSGEHLTDRADLVHQARTDLYKAQCNCSYWHGAFGGLYLPHLRNAVFQHLISADTALDVADGRQAESLTADVADFDLDARKEVRVTGESFVALLKPSRGGHLYEYDIRAINHNLLATLDRRPERYHETIRQHAARLKHEAEHGSAEQHHHGGHDEDEGVSIHDLVHFKQPDLDQKLIYDRWPRKSLVDHFLQPGLSLEDFRRGEGVIGDFETGVYETALRERPDRVEVAMARQGHVNRYSVEAEKTVAFDQAAPDTMSVTYRFSELPAGLPIHFGVEFNFAGMPAGADDRFFSLSGGERIGQLGTVQGIEETGEITLTDEWLGISAGLEVSEPASVWAFPIETISQSEAGFEAVHQSVMVMPRWEFLVPDDGTWEVTITMRVDTSMAEARKDEAEVVAV